MTSVSALISQCRREYGDEPKSVSVSRQGNGSVNLFNTGAYKPILENSYTVYLSGVAKTETTHYTIDLDNGDVQMISTPNNGVEVRVDHKYAFWRDKNWLEAISSAIDELNGRGFFRQVIRNTSIMRVSAGINVYSGPSACVDLYEFLVSDTGSISGNYVKPFVNWAYQQDGNKLVIGSKPTSPNYAAISYLRNLQTPSAVTMTLDTLDAWNEMVKKRAGAIFYRAVAGKIAKEGHATIDEGHFSFTNLRTMANDLDASFEKTAIRKKPTRPAKDMQWNQEGGGVI